MFCVSNNPSRCIVSPGSIRVFIRRKKHIRSQEKEECKTEQKVIVGWIVIFLLVLTMCISIKFYIDFTNDKEAFRALLNPQDYCTNLMSKNPNPFEPLELNMIEYNGSNAEYSFVTP